MTTVASPVSVRELALAIIAKRLNAEPSLQDGLGELGGAVLVDLLLNLEDRFDIGLDVDELLPNGTVGVLVELVALRAAGARRVHHWDDERVKRGLPLCARRAGPAGNGKTVVDGGGSQANPPVDPALAPPAWPDPYVATPRTPCAVPSDEAWMAAVDAFGREERDRARLLVALFVLTPFASGAAFYWLLWVFA